MKKTFSLLMLLAILGLTLRFQDFGIIDDFPDGLLSRQQHHHPVDISYFSLSKSHSTSTVQPRSSLIHFPVNAPRVCSPNFLLYSRTVTHFSPFF